MKRPNILWVCTDQQRSDTIHSLGNDRISTPVLDELCRTGVVFTSAYCQSPICTPSRGSFLSGQYPASTLIHRNGQGGFEKDVKLVTKTLSQSGYVCGLIGKLHLTASQLGMEQRTDDGYTYMEWSHHPYPSDPKFNSYSTWLEQKKGVDPSSIFPKSQLAYGPGVPEEYHQTTWCAEKAMEFIDSNKDSPWLLSINIFDPHPPMDPPKEYLDRYNHETIPFPIFAETDIAHQQKFSAIDQQSTVARDPRIIPLESEIVEKDSQFDEPAGCIPPDKIDARKMIAAYYAQIELIDTQIGRIIDHLRKAGMYDDTIIIFHSDHGELLGDHGLFYKGARFYEALTHVPLIISYPKKFIANTKSNALVELIDLAPTILDSCGIKQDENIQGSSLFSLLIGEKSVDNHKESVLCEFNDALGPKTISNPHAATHGLMCFDGRYKICIYDTGEIGELYDLKEDPNEFTDLWDNPNFSNIQNDMMKKLIFKYMRTASKGFERIAEY